MGQSPWSATMKLEKKPRGDPTAIVAFRWPKGTSGNRGEKPLVKVVQ
jgi:hypothetical protein